MANSTINFNPAKFAGGVAKSFVSATTQVISSYMPFTSELLSDASDTVFNVKEFVAENRPDRNIRGGPTLLKSFANKSLLASKTLLSDLSRGDLSFETSRNQLGNYLSKYKKDEFDFGFDTDDLDFEFDDEDYDNSEGLEGKQFTVEDFAEGIYESTSATIGAIETSSKNIALMNAKSNSVLGDRLIANNMVNMNQTMQMFEVVNKNISGVNNNLASLVEYNNTTMNSFIENTMTHFNKVESFMDMMAKRFVKQEEEQKKKASTSIFEGTRINLGNLAKKGIVLLDEEFLGNAGVAPFLAKWLGGVKYGDKMPKWLDELVAPTDFGEMIKYFNPMTMVVETLFPELGQLKRTDNIAKVFAGQLKKRLTSGAMFKDTPVGNFLKKLFNIDDENDIFRTTNNYKNEESTWTTSDRIVLQNIIPNAINETNNNLVEIGTNVANIVQLLENHTKIYSDMQNSLADFHIDSLKFYKYKSKRENVQEFDDLIKYNQQQKDIRHKNVLSRYKRYAKVRASGSTRANDYRLKHDMMFDAETGDMESVYELYDKLIEQKTRAYDTGVELAGDFLSNTFFQNGRFESVSELVEAYGLRDVQAFKALKDEVSTFLQGVFDEFDSVINSEHGQLVNRYTHELNVDAIYKCLLDIAEHHDISLEDIGIDKIDFYRTFNHINDERKKSIKNFEDKFLNNPRYRWISQRVEGEQFSDYRLFNASNLKPSDLTKRRLGIQSGDEVTESIVTADLDRQIREYKDYLKRLQNVSSDADISADDALRGLEEQREHHLSKARERLDRRQSKKSWAINLSKHRPNSLVGGIIHSLTSRFENFVKEYIEDGRDAFSNASGFNFADLRADIAEYADERMERYPIEYDENGRPIAYWTRGAEWGKAILIGPDGKIQKEIDDKGRDGKKTWFDFRDEMERKGYYEGDNHHFYKDTDDGKSILTDEQWIPKYETGATRIDKDKIVQVHEGEMILDKSLSEGVRSKIVHMINSGGFDKMSAEDQKALVEAIESSDERYKGQAQKVINMIHTEAQKHDLEKGGFSDQNVCRLDLDPDDSPSIAILKTLSEMSINIRTMLSSFIGEANDEEGNSASVKLKGNLASIFGEFDKENKVFKGGLLSKGANNVSDDLKYWLFQNFGGFSYTGSARDENGNIIAGETKSYKNGEDNPETIGKQLKGTLLKRAEELANEMGLSDADRKRYINSLNDIVGGAKGAGKGWVAGLAIKAMLGLSLGPIFGIVGGFALANETTRELIIGAETTDEDGNKYRYGGIFSGIVNQFTELGRDVKMNFLTTAKEVGDNLRNATTMFIDELMNRDKPTIIGQILTGVKDAAMTVASTVTDVTVDAAQFGAKFVIGAAKIPFNMVAGLIGGKEYREAIKDKKFDTRNKELQAIYRELAASERLNSASRLSRSNAAFIEGHNGVSLTRQLAHGASKLPGMAADKASKTTTDIGETISTTLPKLAESLDTFRKQNSIGLKGLINMVPAAAMLATGNIPAALMFAGFNLTNFLSEKATGLPIVGMIAHGVTLLKNRISNKLAPVGEFIDNNMHALKLKLGIKDKGFFGRKMRSRTLSKASILSDLGIDEKTQARYYEWKKNGNAGFSEDEIASFLEIENMAKSGLSKSDMGALNQFDADDARYKELAKRESDQARYDDIRYKIENENGEGVSAEDMEFYKNYDTTGLRFGYDEKEWMRRYKKNRGIRSQQRSLINRRKELFKSKYGSEDNITSILHANADGNFATNQAVTAFRGSASGLLNIDLIKAMYPGISDEDAQSILVREQGIMDENRSKLRGKLLKQFGSITDENLDQVKAMIAADKNLGKDAEQIKGWTLDQTKQFALGNSVMEKALEEGKLKEEEFRNKITGTKDSILSTVTDSAKTMRDIFGFVRDIYKFKTDPEGFRDEQARKLVEDINKQGPELSGSPEMVNPSAKYGVANFRYTTSKNANPLSIASYLTNDKNIDVNSDAGVGLVLGGSKVYDEEEIPAHAEGVLNVRKTGPALIHKGEAVLDAESASSFRQGKFGISGAIADTLGYLKSGIGDLVTVFKGDKTGSEEDKKSFLDKMKDSFTGVGDKITGAVFGSGLIPLTPLGKPDIAKIGARLIALLGGVLVLGPIISKVAEKLKPIFEPLWEGVKSAVKTGVETIKTVIYDMAGVSSFQELMHKIGAEIHIGWKNIGKYSASQSINKANTEFSKDKTAENTIANRKTIETNIKASGSDMNFSDYTAFCNTCQRYFEAIIEFGKFAATEASRIQSKRNSVAGTAGGILGVTASVVSYATGISKPQRGIKTRAFESQLTSSEKQYINSSVAKNSAKLLGPITGNWFAFESANMMSDFCQVIKSETGVQVTYEDNAFVADTNTSAAKIQRGTEIMNTRIGILNTLRNTGGGSTSYFADQFKSQIAARQNEINAANTTAPTATTSDDSAGQGIGYGYTQNDPRWSNMGYGRFKSGGISTMGSGGCGPTAMSNVYSQLTGRSINPAQMARFSQANGYNAQGGTSAGLFTSGARKLGLTSRAIGKSGSAIGKSVMGGNNVIIAGKNGPYTKSGHIMSVRGVDGFGNAIVDDPLRRGARRIPMSKLTKGMTHAWSIGHGNTVGYGEMIPYTIQRSGGTPYSTWSVFDQANATFNVNGGGFGFERSLDSACIYKSLLNAWINSIMGPDETFDMYANNYHPSKLLYDGVFGNAIRTSDTFINSAEGVINALNSISGGSIKFTDLSNMAGSGKSPFESIMNNLASGNPIVFSSNTGTDTRNPNLTDIINYVDNSDLVTFGGKDKGTSMHGVVLAGLYKKNGKEYVVVDNPGSGDGGSQLELIETSAFKDAIDVAMANNNTFGGEDQLHRIYAFNKNPVKTGGYDKTKLGTPAVSGVNATSSAYSGLTLNNGTTNLFTGGLKANNTTSSSIVPENLLVPADHASFGDYLADIIGRLAQFGSNLLGTFISGKTDGLIASGGGSSGYANGGTVTPYMNASMASSNYSVEPKMNIMDLSEDAVTVIVMDYIKKTYENKSDSTNKRIAEIFPGKDVTDANYNAYKKYNYGTGSGKSKFRNAVANALAASDTYRSIASSMGTSNAKMFTWILAMYVKSYPNSIFVGKDKAFKSSDAVLKRIDADAKLVYEKFNNLLMGSFNVPIGTSIDGHVAPISSLAMYNALPDWTKTGSLTFYNNPGIPDFENAMNYSATVTPIGETSTQFPPKNLAELERMYFNIYNDNGLPSFGRSGFHFGRNGGYPGDAVFEKLQNHPNPNVVSEAANYYSTIRSVIASGRSFPKSTITGSKDFLDAMIQAEDAANIELKSDYFRRIYNANSGITDPRIYALGGDILCIAPAKSTLLTGINDLNRARSALHGVAGWAGPRVDGVYGLLTSGAGTINGTTWNMEPYSIGNGDAGYNMRDNYHMYSDDVYMGDADHPMNVTMDNTPVTSRLDKLVDLLDYAVNYKEEPKAGPTNAISLGNGTGEKPKKAQKQPSNKGTTNIGQTDKLANIHAKIARRTRVGANYNHM